MTSCRRIVNASCEYTAGGQITVQNKGCEVKVTVSHVGIEPDLLSERLRLPQYVWLSHRVPSAAHQCAHPCAFAQCATSRCCPARQVWEAHYHCRRGAHPRTSWWLPWLGVSRAH